MKSIEDVRTEMNDVYASGNAYNTDLPFDEARGRSIRSATLCLAMQLPEETFHVHRDRVLDVGSGEGGIASFWPRPELVTGVEISQVAINKARNNCPLTSYHCCAIEQYELGAGQKPYPLVVAQESIEHWTDARKGLDAIYRCMPMDGALIITTPNRDSLHCRMSRKLGMGEPPLCSTDHIHEFGYHELLKFAARAGFAVRASLGVGLLPYWTMERMFGTAVRYLTDQDPEVVTWFERLGGAVPPEFAFIQCHSLIKSYPQLREPYVSDSQVE